MNISKIHISLICFFITFFIIIEAQNSYQIGILPSFNLNTKLKKEWSLNSKIESRQLLQQGSFDGSNINREYQYILTDLALMSAKKIGLNSRIAGGYLIRFREGEIFHRSIQQITTVQAFSGFRLAHRFSSDQTFHVSEKPEFRFRYRVSFEIPLNGQSVDPKEFYLKINNEILNGFQNGTYDLEIRLVPLLGYDFTDNNRLEIGLDYRVNSFLKSNTSRNSFWMSLNWFIVLKNLKEKA